jgi:large conductance mechanosensitive channel
MLREFKAFLIKENILGLALAVVIGTALGKVVTSIVEQLIMPFVGMVTPSGSWRELVIPVGTAKFGIGALLGALVDFIIIGFVVWRISKVFIKPAPAAPAAATKPCPFCRMTIDAAATRCPHCTSQLDGSVVTPPADARLPGARPA